MTICRLPLLLLLLLASVLGANAYAFSSDLDTSSSADSIPGVELQEVVIKGRTQRVIDHGVEYIPDKRTKRNSLDAVNLLEKMHIPQLYIDPRSSEVKTSGRDDVSFFIDYRPASSEQLKGLRPEDVIRVEVLDFPVDSRFNGALHVVNYIMQHYEWGGYTRLGFNTHFLPDNDFVGNLFSRMVYKNWTFDAYCYGDYNFLNRSPGSSTQTFRNVDFLGKHFDEIRRESYDDYYKSRFNSEGASIQLTYGKDNMYILHSVSFNRRANPVGEDGKNVKFSIPDLSDTESVTKSSTQSLSPSVYGYYWFQFPKQNYFSASWSFSYEVVSTNWWMLNLL